MYWQQAKSVLKDAKERGWVNKWDRVYPKDYEYQENTILDLRWFTYEEPWIIRSHNSWIGEQVRYWHMISIIWEVDDWYIGLSDLARGCEWYVLVQKNIGTFYTYEL